MSRRVIRFLVLALGSSMTCQSWIHAQGSRTKKEAAKAIETLQSWYVPSSGLYRTTGWWNSANALTAVVDYSRMSGDKRYLKVIPNTFLHGQEKFPGFINQFYDDEGWWALAWIDAFDLTHDRHYLDAAGLIFTDMAAAWDSTCGGGIWWSKEKSYKNAIANELFLSVAAYLATRTEGSEQRERYTTWANKEWAWFKASGMINSSDLVNDGLVTATCKNNQKTVWTYNQGVILGGLAELSRVQQRSELLAPAQAIADAAISSMTDRNGILHEVCEPNCGADGVQFKGILLRNLAALQQTAQNESYAAFIGTNADSIWNKARGPHNRLGEVWSGPYATANAASQSSALDALIAASTVGAVRKLPR
jgi:predicted alpha-1,6-mannanase (GH76 family)